MSKGRRTLGIWKVLVAVPATIVVPWLPQSATAAISDCIDAACRITTADGSRGTGCVYAHNQGQVYVLTAAHVVGNSLTVSCEFWRHGHRSVPLRGSVILRVENEKCDAAVVVLTQRQFGGIVPPAVPLAPRDHVVRPGATLVSVGCAKGAWSTGWKGHALGYRGADLHFRPTPADGRSGSAIFNAEGTRIVALLRARTSNGSEGIACSLQSLYRHLGNAIDSPVPDAQLPHDFFRKPGPPTQGLRAIGIAGTNAQCPGGGCDLLPYQGKLLPYGHLGKRPQTPQAPEASPGGTGPWPTLPAPSPPEPLVDLKPIDQKLDRIADLLQQIKAAEQPPTRIDDPGSAGSPTPADQPKALEAAQAAAEAAAAFRDESKRNLSAVDAKLGKTEDKLGELQSTVKTWITENGSLKERFEARMDKVRQQLGEEASQREIRIAYLKDLITEKVGEGGVVGVLKLLGMPTGMIVAAWLVSRRIRRKRAAGEPLLIQRLLADVGELKSRIHDRLHPDEPEAPRRAKR